MMNHTRMNHEISRPAPAAIPGGTITLEQVAGLCNTGECPTVYRTNRGTLVVQGLSFNPAEAGVGVPPGEQMVEIPAELLAEYARSGT